MQHANDLPFLWSTACHDNGPHQEGPQLDHLHSYRMLRPPLVISTPSSIKMKQLYAKKELEKDKYRKILARLEKALIYYKDNSEDPEEAEEALKYFYDFEL